MSGEIEMLLRGVLLGIAVAAPVGPIGVLCIQRSMAAGFWAGFSGGIGTALADALYATLAAAGFAALAGVTEGMAGQVLRWAGAAFIAWLGWRTMLAPAATRAAESGREERPWRLLAVTFALTMSNPATILSFAALFAGLGLAADATPATATAAVAGVFIGSLLWWAFLSGSVAVLRHRIDEGWKRWINRIAGAVLIAFALALVL
ncbi:MAG TPA: LysE family transporter [Ferrovibrio sp.]|uniref:LysE family translocator n=1 Tax=Ferrovibrio sp. TaxID=1917215 RepID=UPI002B4AE8C6|nr:LysE family transporter [Ferrovibrio sp.]HLT78013.1 LysE family transporter [Ferrovibrio sp.]